MILSLKKCFPSQRPLAFAELMGEPGRPVWALWELLKWMVGKSDHTIPAISKKRTDKTLALIYFAVIDISKNSRLCVYCVLSFQCWPSLRCPTFSDRHLLSSSRRRSCRGRWMSCWALTGCCFTRLTLEWHPSTTTHSSDLLTSPTQVGDRADPSEFTVLF